MRWTLEHLRRRSGVALTIVVALAVLLAAGAVAAWRIFGPERFEQLDLADGGDGTTDLPADPEAPLALSDSTRVYLVYSVGSKGLSGDEARRLRINDLESRGADGLTDTMMLLFVDPPTRRAALLSIPRDTWLFDRGHRLNASYNLHGLQAFVDDVSTLVGVPIHHVVQVNFAGFAQLVDDVGGIAIEVERPLADVHSVLYVPQAGCWRFDGAAALAYARSRHTLTQRGDRWVVHSSASDVGRMARQRQLLAAAWQQLRGPSLITKIPSLLSAAKRGLTLDDGLGVRELASLASTFADIGPWGIEAYTLPTTGRRISGAAAQVVAEDAAKPVLRRLRAWPPGREPGPSDAPTASPSQPSPSQPPPSQPPSSPTGDPQPTPGETSPDPTAEPSTSPSPDTPSPSPTADVEVETLGEPPEDCTLRTAAELPDPSAPLVRIYRERGGEGGLPGEDDAEPSPSPDEQPTDQPTDGPTDEPTDEPSPSDDPSPGPTLTIPPLPG